MERLLLNQFGSKYGAFGTLEIQEKILPSFVQKLEELKLPSELIIDLTQIYLPFYYALGLHRHSFEKPVVIGINGPQGSGKTTFAGLFKTALEKGFGLKVVCLSLDDFYMTRKERLVLSEKVHPLLKTRGVPGTHDASLGVRLFHQLLNMNSEGEIAVPRFDKSLDDRFPEEQWEMVSKRPDVILFEGWCVGAKPQSSDELTMPVNELEKNYDPDGSFRQYVNDSLAGLYQTWFSLIDVLIMLKVPSFEKVLEWRWLQEQKLMESLPGNENIPIGIMTKEQVLFFVSHFERITRHMFQEMPLRADYVIDIDANHRMCGLSIRS